MSCHCHPEPNQTSEAAHVTQQVVVPCDPKTLARLQAEYLPKIPMPGPLELCELASAQELCRKGHIKLKPDAEALLDDDLSPQAYLGLLQEKGHLAEARRVLAHTLPRRRALWWACLCTRHAYQGDQPRSVERAVEAVVRFVRDPSETNRREAETVGRSLPSNRLEGCLAMAAFFSGGSVSLPHLPIVPPRPFVTGRLVGVCVYLASVTRSAMYYKDHLRQYLALGCEIARGENLWYERGIEPRRIDPVAGASVPNTMHGRQLSRCPTAKRQEEASDAQS